MTATGGRVVRTPTEAKPYKVVLEHGRDADTQHPVSTVREGEALIRQESPPPPKLQNWRAWNSLPEDTAPAAPELDRSTLDR